MTDLQRDLAAVQIQPPHLLTNSEASRATRHLPAPPTDDELPLYFGPQHRWVPVMSFLCSVLVITSVLLFLHQRPWAAVLLVPTAINAFGSVVSLISSSRRRRFSFADHSKAVSEWQPDYIPSVDIFLPTAGESLDVLRNTYEHVSRVQWHGNLHVIVLDDADRRDVREAALDHGFTYNVRGNRGHLKKAGNLLAGFNASDGDFILVLDADFAPRPDIFYQVLPYMDDRANGIVQTPQYFDINRQRNSIQRAAGATQVLFYRWVQPSRDKSNAAICVGTCAVYRREALHAAGGFAQIGHSEDVHTGVNMMAVGYRVRYVPILVAKGLCPDTFDSFVTQQYRWCAGSMSLLLSKQFHRHDLTAMQRLSYWSGFMYYISTGINVFTFAFPPVLVGILAPRAVNPTNYALVFLALTLRAAMVPIITQGRSSINSLTRIQMTYSFAHFVALYDQIRKRPDTWVPTGAAARSRTAQRVGALSRAWCIGVQVALWSILVWRVPEFGLNNFWPLLVFTALNLWLIIPIIVRRELRSAS